MLVGFTIKRKKNTKKIKSRVITYRIKAIEPVKSTIQAHTRHKIQVL